MRKYLLLCCVLMASCTTTHRTAATPGRLRFLDKYVVPFNRPFEGTTIGGLSGIDYDSARGLYYMICDDRSERQPARFYTARIPLKGYRIDSVQFMQAVTLQQPGGGAYSAAKDQAPDPEAMRYNPHTGRLVWSSEGERIVTVKDTVLKDPGIYGITTDGHFTDSLTVPSLFRMQAVEAGPRRNGTFEGLGFTANGRYLFVSLEEPRYEDGPRAGLRDTTAYTRIVQYDLRTRKAVAQYAYKLAPVAQAAVPPEAFLINGISDILVLSEKQLLVMERSYSTGVKDCTIRLFIVNLEKATDVSNIPSLQANTAFKPARKIPFFNFESLGTYVDNVEGMTFGPLLPNGHRSLVFVADNNFSEKEETQFFLFEIE